MNINININNKTICPYCLGRGNLQAMQVAALIGGGSVRVQDTEIKCNHCDGVGLIDTK